MDISEQIRGEISRRIEAGTNLFALAREAEISYPILLRFMRGERDMYLATAAKLATFLGVELIRAKGKKIEPAKAVPRTGPLADLAALVQWCESPAVAECMEGWEGFWEAVEAAKRWLPKKKGRHSRKGR